jgi:hypothetical protein
MAESKVVRLSKELVESLEVYRKLRIKFFDLYDPALYGDHWEREKRVYANKSLIDLLEDCVFSSVIDLESDLNRLEGLKDE